ncbi:hypothetical protein CsSME_00016503 [Camellia sinensis var. sinensis]
MQKLPIMMMHAVFGSAIIIRKRVMTQFFPPRWKKFWNEWEVRGMVLISLTTQVLLVILGNRRKHSAGI